jgi:HupE / UreJ protein
MTTSFAQARRTAAAFPDLIAQRWGKRYALVLFALLLLLSVPVGVATAASAAAHPLSTTAILLNINSTNVTGQIELPIDRLAIALDQPLTANTVIQPDELERLRAYVQGHISATGAGTAWDVAVTDGSTRVIDGVDHLIFDLTMTPTGSVSDFTLTYDAIVEHLLSHKIFVSARAGTDGTYTSVGMLDWSGHSISIAAADFAPSLAAGFFSSVRLGFTHITEGADHLLFLLMLLLTTPLVARGGRWVQSSDLKRDSRQVVHVVTAFAIGHSITLALGALGLVEVPTRVVESLIALSVVVAGLHAIRPLVGGGEAWIAGLFGLMHGLAFASLITELNLGRESLIADLLGFNVGIELTQLVVVALVMPSLLLLSRGRLYKIIRPTLATIGVVLAVAWLAERTTLITVNPLQPITDALIDYPLGFVALLAALAVASWTVSRRRASRASRARTSIEVPEGSVVRG